MVKLLRSLKFVSFLSLCSWSLASLNVHAYEKVLSGGVQTHSADWETGDASFDSQDFNDTSYHFGFRLYNAINPKHMLGVGLDYDEILSENLIGYRAIDYQYIFSERYRVGAFFGAASLDTGLPQNGYYYGVNALTFISSNRLALQYELKVGDGLARDRLLESDPEGEKPDIFLDFIAHTLALQWHF